MPRRDSRAWCLGIIEQWKQLEWRSPILNSLLDYKPYRNNKMAADILRLASAEKLGIDDLRLTAYLLEPVLDALGREAQGRKRILTIENMQLLNDVDALVARSRMSARSACAHLLTAPKYASRSYRGLGRGALFKRYLDAKRRRALWMKKSVAATEGGSGNDWARWYSSRSRP